MNNSKLNGLRAELEKNNAKILKLQVTNKKLSGKITELENTCIIGMVREYSLTPEKLAELLSAMKNGKTPFSAFAEAEHED